MSEERTGLDYARQVLEDCLALFEECKHDPMRFQMAIPGVNAALANFLAAEAAERQDPSK